MSLLKEYVPATRHPWPSLVFILPLLVAYEVGVLWLGGAQPETIRNGADHWVRSALDILGLKLFWVPPVILVVVFAIWAWLRREDRPKDVLGALSGMVLESVTLALGLWGISRMLAPMLVSAGVELSMEAAPSVEPALRQTVTYLGAGLYEEALFRLLLYTMMATGLQALDVPRFPAVLLAAVGSAVVFSTAHHVGPYGQPYSNYLFLFRLAAGLYFAFVYETRGFGIAVGAHACYNVMVSIA